MRFISLLVVAAMLAACGFTTHYTTNSTCAARCEPAADYLACLKQCPGVTRGDGPCNRDDLDFGDVCTEQRTSTTVGKVLIVVGVVLIGAVGYGVYQFKHEFDENFNGGSTGLEHSYDPH